MDVKFMTDGLKFLCYFCLNIENGYSKRMSIRFLLIQLLNLSDVCFSSFYNMHYFFFSVNILIWPWCFNEWVKNYNDRWIGDKCINKYL